MTRGYELSESLEDYLEAIYRLILESDGARVKDIAEALGVRKPSVTVALSALEKRGLIIHERYGGVTLTKEGYDTAVSITERHRLLRGFFANVLGCQAAVADETACRVEHALPAPVFTRLAQFVKYLYVSREDPEAWIADFRRFAEGGEGKKVGPADMERYFDGTGFVLEGEGNDGTNP